MPVQRNELDRPLESVGYLKSFVRENDPAHMPVLAPMFSGVSTIWQGDRQLDEQIDRLPLSCAARIGVQQTGQPTEPILWAGADNKMFSRRKQNTYIRIDVVFSVCHHLDLSGTSCTTQPNTPGGPGNPPGVISVPSVVQTILSAVFETAPPTGVPLAGRDFIARSAPLINWPESRPQVRRFYEFSTSAGGSRGFN